MASHKIDITVLNTPLGVPASDDGVMGIIVQATAVASTFVLSTPYLLTKVADLTTLGITAVNNPAVYQHVTEFYADGDGAKLWLLGITDTTPFATYVASDPFKAFVRATGASDPLNQVKVLGLCYKIPSAAQSATDFPTDVTDSVTLFKTALKALFDEGYHLCGVIDGYNMKSTITISDLGTLNTRTDYNVGVCITGTAGNGVSSIGLLLGKIARISIGTSIGKVADGSITANAMYLTNGITTSTAKKVNDLTPTEVESLGSKQFIFARNWFGKSGYYWNDGATACASDLALSTLEFNRIANTLSTDALNFFTNEIGSNLPVEVSTGNLDKGYIANKQQQFVTTYVSPLILSGDISGATLTITGVNFISTRTLTFALKIVASPALGNVTGTIEFTKTL
jgi:hypothetical protein